MPIDLTGGAGGLFPGSQEGEAVDYVRMPTQMATWSQPLLPEPEDVNDYPRVMEVLRQVTAQLQQFADQGPAVIDLLALDADERRLLDQFLGEGEVSIIREDKGPRLRVQESVFAGLWRVQSSAEDGRLLQDQLEVAAIPQLVMNAAADKEPAPGQTSEQLMNARPVLNEIIDRNRRYSTGSAPHIINLSLLPVNEADLQWLDEQLGFGGVEILSRGYGNCRITRTGLRNVWWVRYFNSMDTPIQLGIEITDVPEVACAAAEDIADSARRLEAMLEDFQ